MANNRPDRTERPKSPVRQDNINGRPLYNDHVQEVIMTTRDGFAERLASLRMAKQVSAREMSLSLGQGAGYINNIENGHNLPSMAMFFEICEYLNVTPVEFFNYCNAPEKTGTDPLSDLDDKAARLISELADMLRSGQGRKEK